MNTKNILVSFLLVASVLLLTATASAASITSDAGVKVKVNGIDISGGEIAAVVAGDTMTVKVRFTAEANASDVRIKVTLEGKEEDLTEVTSKFDVKDGVTYDRTLSFEVPSDFDEDELSNTLPLEIKIWSADDDVDSYEKTFDEHVIVQRDSYEISIKSVITSNIVEAGESMSIGVVLRNTGYNNADDVYVTASIPELGISRSVYLGDIVTGACERDDTCSDDDDSDTVTGTIVLQVPSTAKSGIYTLQIDALTEDSRNTVRKEIAIENKVPNLAIKSGSDLILLNPTNKLTVYTVKYLSKEETVVVPAASSRTVTIIPSDKDFDVAVYSGGFLISTVQFTGSSTAGETTKLTNPVFVLTVVLAIVFLVLLVVLVVLLTKKPKKSEEFGESYY